MSRNGSFRLKINFANFIDDLSLKYRVVHIAMLNFNALEICKKTFKQI